MSAQRVKFSKDPQAVLDYQIDWSAWLPEGDTIVASTWSGAVIGGITIESDSFTDATTTVWLSGGTENVTYSVTNHITTAEGREEDQTIQIGIRSR